MNNKIIITDIYRCKNKQSFFALHQIHSKIKSYRPDIDVEFHILWDNNPDGATEDLEKWENLINTYGFNLTSYDKEFFINYATTAYDVPRDEICTRLDKFFPLYFVLLTHYLRRVKLMDYCLIYDDDILINYDFKDVVDAILVKRPVMITEPYNIGCDKSLSQTFIEMLGKEFITIYLQKNPNQYGFNAGFQGLDLRMMDEFMSASGFVTMLNIFDYTQIFDSEGNEIVDRQKRAMLETQQQSFFSLLNTVMSKNELFILDPSVTYVAPNFGYCHLHGEIKMDDGLNGWGVCLNSNISHFIGVTEGRGKPKEFLERVDGYLKQEGFM